jgi:hypothetical protein
MTSENAIAQRVIAAQSHMFRLAESRHGLTRKVLHLETGIPMTTLKTWANGTAMPVYGLAMLTRVIPDYLTSLLLEPACKGIVTPEEGDGDLDTLAVEASSYVADYVAAKADGVVTPIETARLREDRRRVRSAAA